MSTTNPFEAATRLKLRLASVRGDLSIEMLWDIPLRSRDDFNLDHVAKTASRAAKELSEESFVETAARTPAQVRAGLALEVVKYVIEVKLAEEAADKQRADRKLEKEKLLRILAEKQDGKLGELGEKELQKRIAALSD